MLVTVWWTKTFLKVFPYRGFQHGSPRLGSAPHCRRVMIRGIPGKLPVAAGSAVDVAVVESSVEVCSSVVRVEVVAVAYADWEKADSVPPAEVARFAKRFRYRAFLLDTFAKDGKTLLDWMTPAEVAELVSGLKRCGVQVAVGGSLKLEQVRQLKNAAPDWFAVRGAVCAGGKRDGVLDPVRVKKWKESVKA